jgi:hypothetical protein
MISTVNSPRGRRLLSAAVLTAALIGGAALGTASAGAAPEWDIGAYDRCLLSMPKPDDAEQAVDHMHWCCFKSGGQWNAAEKKCQTPPADPAEAHPTLPGEATRPVLATQNPAPPPPPVRNPGVLQTFTSAPVGLG